MRETTTATKAAITKQQLFLPSADPLQEKNLTLPQTIHFRSPDDEQPKTSKSPLNAGKSISTENSALDALNIPIAQGGVFVRAVSKATPDIIAIATNRGTEGKSFDSDTAKKALKHLKTIADKYEDEDFGKQAKSALEKFAKDDEYKLKDYAKSLIEKKK